jgi:hypothetical protein
MMYLPECPRKASIKSEASFASCCSAVKLPSSRTASTPDDDTEWRVLAPCVAELDCATIAGPASMKDPDRNGRESVHAGR